MKSKILNALLGLAIYLFVGAIFYGYHYFMIIGFMVLLAGCGFFLNYRKNTEEVSHNLFYLSVPVVLLLLTTSFFTDTIKLGVMYFVVASLTSIIVYFAIKYRQTKQKLIFPIVLILWIALATLTANTLLEGEQKREDFVKLF